MRMLRVFGPVHEIPNPEARVTISSQVTDKWGIPVAQLSGTTHPETLRIHQYINGRAEEWLRASGANGITSSKASLV